MGRRCGEDLGRCIEEPPVSELSSRELNKYDALLFDFDGVLADTETLHHQAWNETLKPFGIQFSWDEYVKHCVGIADRIVAQRLQLGVDEKELVISKQTTFRTAMEAAPPFLESTLDFVRQLAVDHKLAVVSSSGITEVDRPLVQVGIRQCFQLVVTCEDVQRLKPFPDPYLLAAERLDARRPLVIEDSEAGVASARAAGFDLVRVTSPATMAAEVREFLQTAKW